MDDYLDKQYKEHSGNVHPPKAVFKTGGQVEI